MANVPTMGEKGIFDIDTFKSHIAEWGTLPTSRYYMDIPLPNILRNCSSLMNDLQAENININDMLRFRAEHVRGAPGVTLNLTQVNRYGIGPLQKFPYNAQFNDMTITFLADKYSVVWGFFYNWLNSIFYYGHDPNPEADGVRYRVSYMDDYVTTSQLNVYDYDGKPSTSIELIDFYPIAMADIDLAWGDVNQTKKINVTFTYRHWRMPFVEVCNDASRVTRPSVLNIPRNQRTIVSAKPEKPEQEIPQGRVDQSVPAGPQIYPDPMINHQNPNGKFNNPTVPQGTDQPVFHMGA